MPGNILIVGKNTAGLDKFCPLVNSRGWKLFAHSRGVIQLFDSKRTKCFPIGTADSCPQRLAGHRVPNSRIFAGIMANRDDQEDMNNIQDLEITPIDIVVIDPEQSFVRQVDGKQSFNVGEIDINPSILILAAIQNSRWVTPVVSMKDRGCVIHEIMKDGEVCLLTKQVLASNALAWLSSNTKFLSDVVHHHIGKQQPVSGKRTSVT